MQPAPQAGPVLCPHCSAAVAETPGEQPRIVTCPGCSSVFILPAADGSTLAVANVPGITPEEPFVIDDTEPESTPTHDEDLSAIRIQQIAVAKRAANRSRSYCIVVAAAALALAGQCIFLIARHAWRHDSFVKPLAYILLAPILLWLALNFYRRSERWRHEAEQTSIPQPDRPPDFDQLSDGSQYWKNLDPGTKQDE